LGVNIPESRAEPSRSLKGLKSRGGVDVLNLDISANKNTKILVRVDDFDQRPSGALNLGESWAKRSVRAVLGAQDDSLIAVDSKARGNGEVVDDWKGPYHVFDGVGFNGKIIGSSLDNDVIERR
jgi:hypothetical protein